ncbi:MAG: ATP-dependent 6-phosphofructokinase [Pseudomonadota bacterium]
MALMKIGIVTGGGDCPGINSVIKWIVKTATDPLLYAKREGCPEFQVVGSVDGYKGLIEVDPDSPESVAQWLVPLDEDAVRTWDRYGGTRLGTARVDPFYHSCTDCSERLLDNVRRLGIGVLVVVGGVDTLGCAYKLSRMGIKVIGIPKTIDKDVVGTDYTLGHDSALNVITQEIDRLRTTAGSHSRIFVVETMGQRSGWLALDGGQAAAAFIILIPEYDYDLDRICEMLKRRRESGIRYTIVVIAEGAKSAGGQPCYISDELDGFGHKVCGGIARELAAEIGKRTGLETRHVNLSHLQRGGAPSAFDRKMGRRFGIAAVDLILSEDFGRMVAVRLGQITSVPLRTVASHMERVDVRSLYDSERYNGRRKIL